MIRSSALLALAAMPLPAVVAAAVPGTPNPQSMDAAKSGSPRAVPSDIIVTAHHPVDDDQVAEKSRLGTLGDADVFSTPFSTKAYTSTFIRDQNARSINDIVANDPSIRVSLSPSFVLDQSSIRGFLVTGSSYLFDNLPGFSPHYGSVPIQHFERIDIFKGPASALTAAVGTIGGTINLVPKRATDLPVTSVTASLQNDVLVGGHLDIGRRFGHDGAFGVRFNLSGEKGQLYDGGKREQWVPTIALDYQSGPFRAVLDAGYIEYKSNAPGVIYTLRPGATLPRVPDPRINPAPRWTYVDNESYYVLGTLEADLAEDLTVYGRYGQNRQYVQRTNLFFGPLNSAGQFAVTGYSYGPWRNVKKTGEIGLRSRIRTGPLLHNIVVSAQQFTGGSSDFGGVETAASGLPDGSIYAAYALVNPYANGLPADNIVQSVQPRLRSVAVADDISLLDERLRIIFGARRQRIEQGVYDQSRTTPTVAVLYKLADTVSVYGNYAQGLSQGAVAPLTVTNPGAQLPPYVSRQHEFGAKWKHGTFGATLAYFDIAQDFAFIDTTNTFVVGGQQRHRGVELETFGEPLPGLRVLGGAARIDARQAKTATGATTGNKALGVPTWTVNLGLEHDVGALPGLTITARYIYTGDSFVNLANTQVVPSWQRIDATARYRFAVRDTAVTVRAGISNLLDDHYWTTGGRNILAVAAPRTAFVAMSADF